MIKANELRIGNLFYPIDRGKDVHMVVQTPFILMSVSQINVRGFLFGQEIHTVIKYDEFSIRDIEPITLTPEILDKCGFVPVNAGQHLWSAFMESGNKYFMGAEYYSGGILSIRDYSDSKYSVKNIYYLHQLQNLVFSLTGEELECAF